MSSSPQGAQSTTSSSSSSAIAVALVALVHAALNSAGFRRWLTSYVEQEIAAQTGTDVTLGGVELRLWPPAVGLEGLLIRDGETGEVLFALSQGHAGLRLRGLKPRLDVLELDNPLIRLDLDALGGGDGGGSLPEELPWRQLLVRGGRSISPGTAGDLGSSSRGWSWRRPRRPGPISNARTPRSRSSSSPSTA